MEEALNIFTAEWKNHEEVTGILLSGSYSVGLENKNSDVDVRLVLRNDQKETVKGLQEINGFSFSYLGRTQENIIKKFNVDFFNTTKMEARIFHVGRIIYEENEILREIKKVACHYYKLPFINKKISEEEMQSMLYALHNRYNFLKETDNNSPFFVYNYILFMKLAFEFYARILNVELIIDTKLEKLLTSPDYISKYNFIEFPDKEFLKIWINNLRKENIDKPGLDQTYNYIKKNIYQIDTKKFHMNWVDNFNVSFG